MDDVKCRKIMMQTHELIEHMKFKGIDFKHFSEEEASKFLDKNNNYFKLTSYRKNFEKYTRGENVGKYVGLDFGYLVDLSTIDMYLRRILLIMCLDIEHYSKVSLLKSIENNDLEDGYNIVKLFIESKNEIKIRNGKEIEINKVIDNITRNINNPYCGQLLKKYGISKETKNIDNFPIWALIEVIPFGDFRELFQFYYKHYEMTDETDVGFLLATVNQLRNAVAHNNCVINNMFPESHNNYKPNYKVMNFLSKMGIKGKIRTSKMSNSRIKQIVTTIYIFDVIVSSEGVRSSRYKELYDLVNDRMKRNKGYYLSNNTISTSFKFFDKIVSYLYKSID